MFGALLVLSLPSSSSSLSVSLSQISRRSGVPRLLSWAD